jgi:hypothetical protein
MFINNSSFINFKQPINHFKKQEVTMKATKLVMITALVSFALMSFANAEFGMSKNVISLKAARNNVELVHAIYEQVSPAAIFNAERAGSYTAQVVLKKTVYLINGTLGEWKLFFRDVDAKSPLCNETRTPASYSEANDFGVCKVKINPLRQKNPFGHAGKKPVSQKLVKGIKGDR